jgi:hypothetical protein
MVKYGTRIIVQKSTLRKLVRDWRLSPELCAYIDCDWGREDYEDSLRLLCGGCIDACNHVVSGSTEITMLQEPYVRGVPR